MISSPVSTPVSLKLSSNLETSDLSDSSDSSDSSSNSSDSDTDDSDDEKIDKFLGTGIENITKGQCWISAFIQMFYNITDFRDSIDNIKINPKDVKKVPQDLSDIAKITYYITNTIKQLKQYNNKKKAYLKLIKQFWILLIKVAQTHHQLLIMFLIMINMVIHLLYLHL